jgi:restriction endonuclease
LETFLISTQIPWDSLKGRDLEEAIYWLLDDLGAKELEWRIGGTGQGTADGGRDLKAAFYTLSPDGEMALTTWWVECKGRDRTVEPTAVKEAVLNAAGRNDVDVLVIATNSHFSNATVDWVANWQQAHRRPLVRLWDQNALERQFAKHPSAAVRVFQEALTARGKLEVIRAGLWNYGHLATEGALVDVWRERTSLQIDIHSLIALVISEAGNGNLTERAWAATVVDPQELLVSFHNALANIFYLSQRLNRVGSHADALVTGMASILLVLLHRLDTSEIKTAIAHLFTTEPYSRMPMDIRDGFYAPVIHRLYAELQDVCSSN